MVSMLRGTYVYRLVVSTADAGDIIKTGSISVVYPKNSSGNSMSLQTDEEKLLIQSHFEDLLIICTRCNSPEDKEFGVKAFNLANEAHKGVRRKSGEPYTASIAVAKIVTSGWTGCKGCCLCPYARCS